MGRIGRREITKAKAVETHVNIVKESKEDKTIKINKKSNARKKKYQIRFSEKEFDKLSNFANTEDINISDLIRLALIEKGVL